MFTDSKNEELIGQEELLNTVNSFNIDTFPHSVLLEGEKGCGRHTLCHIIGNKFGIEIVELNDNSDRKDIETIQLKPYPCLYIIDLSEVIPKFQNSMLKILEEPPAGAFLICLCETTNKVLPTIVNRCVVWSFKKYSADVLKHFVSDYTPEEADIALKVFRTPGKLLSNSDSNLKHADELAKDGIDRIGRASIPNVLSISDKMAYKNEKGKINPDLFIDVLKYEITARVLNSDNDTTLHLHKEVCKMKDALSMCISKQRTFEGYLIRLHGVAHVTE